jgi:hypothetical protein
MTQPVRSTDRPDGPPGLAHLAVQSQASRRLSGRVSRADTYPMIVFRRARRQTPRESLTCTDCGVRVAPAALSERDRFWREHPGCNVIIKPLTRGEQ